MQIRQRTTTPQHQRHGIPQRSAHPVVETAVAPLPALEPSRHESRHRAAGGPQDLAHYLCGCGTRFRAPVSASVACPACGGDQAW